MTREEAQDLLTEFNKDEFHLELKSVKKKYKSKGFAAGCSREVIQNGADMPGLSLDDLIQQIIDALKTFRP